MVFWKTCLSGDIFVFNETMVLLFKYTGIVSSLNKSFVASSFQNLIKSTKLNRGTNPLSSTICTNEDDTSWMCLSSVMEGGVAWQFPWRLYQTSWEFARADIVRLSNKPIRIRADCMSRLKFGENAQESKRVHKNGRLSPRLLSFDSASSYLW